MVRYFVIFMTIFVGIAFMSSNTIAQTNDLTFEETGVYRYKSEPFYIPQYDINTIINKSNEYFIKFTISCVGVYSNHPPECSQPVEWNLNENNSENKKLSINIIYLQNDETKEI